MLEDFLQVFFLSAAAFTPFEFAYFIFNLHGRILVVHLSITCFVEIVHYVITNNFNFKFEIFKFI